MDMDTLLSVVDCLKLAFSCFMHFLMNESLNHAGIQWNISRLSTVLNNVIRKNCFLLRVLTKIRYTSV